MVIFGFEPHGGCNASNLETSHFQVSLNELKPSLCLVWRVNVFEPRTDIPSAIDKTADLVRYAVKRESCSLVYLNNTHCPDTLCARAQGLMTDGMCLNFRTSFS